MFDAAHILSIEHVNQHYLDKVMEVAEEREIEATEDIFDAHGIKLIAKGASISRKMQEKLIAHKLRKPLEACIAVKNGVTVPSIVDEARRIAESVEPVGCILRASEGAGYSAFDILERVQLGSAMTLMLTITERGGATALRHCAMVSLLSICLAKKLGLSEQEQSTVALAGLLHDIGELYIDPAYLIPERRLLPHEWRHIVVHPRIGQMLVEGLDDYSPAVALAVAEHHELCNGAGYPRRIGGKSISTAGQILSVAEMIAGVFIQDDNNPLEHAELALKIIPGEHSHQLVSAISSTLHLTHPSPAMRIEMSSDEATERAKILFHHISTVVDAGNKMNELPTIHSLKGKELLALATTQVDAVRHAFISTGLDVCVRDDAIQNSQILFESVAATKEIQWRLRSVARDLALNVVTLECDERNAFLPLISMLDEEPDSRALGQRSVKAVTLASDAKGGEGEQMVVSKPARSLLLVDDDPHVMSALGRELRPLGYKIHKAENAERALEILGSNEVGVIMSDQRMEGMTGVELLSRVKTRYPQTVRIILSDYSDARTVNDAIRLGAVYQFLTKPWDIESLRPILENAFEDYEHGRQSVSPLGGASH